MGRRKMMLYSFFFMAVMIQLQGCINVEHEHRHHEHDDEGTAVDVKYRS